MERTKAKKVLVAAILAMLTASVAGCYVPHRSYDGYDNYRRDDYRRDNDRRHDRYDRNRDYDRRDRDRW